MAINNCYLDFVQTHGLISLVNDKHMDNNIKEISMNVYYGLIVNNQPNKRNNGCSGKGTPSCDPNQKKIQGLSITDISQEASF